MNSPTQSTARVPIVPQSPATHQPPRIASVGEAPGLVSTPQSLTISDGEDDHLGVDVHEHPGGSGLCEPGVGDGPGVPAAGNVRAPTKPPLPTLQPTSSRYLLPTPTSVNHPSPRPSISRQPLITHLQSPSTSSQVLPPTQTQVSLLSMFKILS